MKLHQTTLIELDSRERQVLRDAGDRYALRGGSFHHRAGRVKKVAKALGIGPETLRQWELGLRRPTWAKFERWRAILGVEEIDLRVAR